MPFYYRYISLYAVFFFNILWTFTGSIDKTTSAVTVTNYWPLLEPHRSLLNLCSTPVANNSENVSKFTQTPLDTQQEMDVFNSYYPPINFNIDCTLENIAQRTKLVIINLVL